MLRLTFIGDAEVDVDQFVELSTKLDIHFLARIIADALLFKHDVDRGQADDTSDEVHAVELLNQSVLDLTSGVKHGLGQWYSGLGPRDRQNLQDKAFFVRIICHVVVTVVLD